MKKTIFCLMVLTCSYKFSSSQLLSNIPVPEDIRFSEENKFANDRERVGGEYKNNYKYKDKINELIAWSNYEMKLLYKSGKVVYNDKITGFVQEVLKKVLVSEPDLIPEIKIYIIRSAYLNAFTFHSGEVFITLGLLAQLENEAELAYILSHEVSHYKLRHHVNNVVNSTNIQKKHRGSSYSSSEARELLEFAFSRELEFEADSLGFLYTKKSAYSSAAALGAMDVLQFSYLPINEIPFNIFDLFEDSIGVPKKYLLEKIHAIDFDSDREEDKRSTHPNVAKRRKYINLLAKRSGNNNGATYVVGKKEFIEIRNLARKEFCSILQMEKEGVSALYNSYVLYKENKTPETEYLLSSSLYEVAMEKQFNEFDKENEADNFKEGEIERAWFFLNELTAEQSVTLALYSAYKNFKKNNNEASKLMYEQLLKTLVNENSITLSDVKAFLTPIIPIKDTLVRDSIPLSEDEDSKYAKLRKQKYDQVTNVDTTLENSGLKFHYNFLKVLLDDKEFVEAMTKYENAKLKDATVENSKEKNAVRVTFGNKTANNRSKSSISNDAISVNKGLILCPIFTSYIYKPEDFFMMQTKQEKFSDEAATYFSKTKVPMDLFSIENLNLDDAKEYSDYCSLMDYVDEVLEKDSKYMPVAYPKVKDYLADKGYSHIVLNHYNESRVKRNNTAQAIFIGLIAFPLFPAAIYYISTKQLQQTCYIAAVDLNTHKVTLDKETILQHSKYKTPADFYFKYIKK